MVSIDSWWNLKAKYRKETDHGHVCTVHTTVQFNLFLEIFGGIS